MKKKDLIEMKNVSHDVFLPGIGKVKRGDKIEVSLEQARVLFRSGVFKPTKSIRLIPPEPKNEKDKEQDQPLKGKTKQEKSSKKRGES